MTESRKQSLYFSDQVLAEIMNEAARLDRSLSWVMQMSWKLARARIRQFPAIADVGAHSPQARTM